jgi:hypothetical protein
MVGITDAALRMWITAFRLSEKLYELHGWIRHRIARVLRCHQLYVLSLK